ncbi:MAG: DUF503 domain-containing protein [Actinobacteria bacterium]|nr:DUF503 domain-containing protein [Actinomycetota bacterium]
MHVSALELDLHLPHCHSLKEKRAVVKTILHGAHNRFGVSVAEVDHQDKWQRASLGFAVVSSRASVADDVLAKVERFVLSFPEVELIAAHWGTE